MNGGQNMKRISIDNGNSWTTPEAAIATLGLDVIVNYMDDDTREAVHNEIAPCTEVEFLAAYLERATDDLIIG
jgi:hypothetical protein